MLKTLYQNILLDPGSYVDVYGGADPSGRKDYKNWSIFFSQFTNIYFTLVTIALVISVVICGILMFIANGNPKSLSETKQKLLRIFTYGFLAFAVLEVVGFIVKIFSSL